MLTSYLGNVSLGRQCRLIVYVVIFRTDITAEGEMEKEKTVVDVDVEVKVKRWKRSIGYRGVGKTTEEIYEYQKKMTNTCRVPKHKRAKYCELN
jgi:hypothetical protein